MWSTASEYEAHRESEVTFTYGLIAHMLVVHHFCLRIHIDQTTYQHPSGTWPLHLISHFQRVFEYIRLLRLSRSHVGHQGFGQPLVDGQTLDESTRVQLQLRIVLDKLMLRA